MSDSKAHWLNIRHHLDEYEINLGRATAQAYVNDPKMIAFIAARYKFVSKMLVGAPLVIEIGCGDAFGAPIVAQTVKKLICTDIDDETLMLNRANHCERKNIEFHYYDFRIMPWQLPVNAIYLVDVIEHIFPEEEEKFMENIYASLTPTGILIVGTPNKNAEQYASKHSIEGHVNLKTQSDLRSLLLPYFSNTFCFSMNDEVVHTGFGAMANYNWVMGIGLK